MIYYIGSVFAIIFILVDFSLVKNNKLSTQYLVLWLILSIFIIILSLNRGLLESISHLLGVYYAPSILFLFGIVFLIFYALHLSIVLTQEQAKTIKLVQEVAILKEKMNEKK